MFPEIGIPRNGWFIMENPIRMDDLGVPLFSETPICISIVIISKISYFLYTDLYIQLLCNYMCTYQRIMQNTCAPLKPYKWIFRVASPKKEVASAYPIWLETLGNDISEVFPFTLLASLHVGGYRLLGLSQEFPPVTPNFGTSKIALERSHQH